MRKLMAVILVAAGMASLAGCGGSSSSTNAPVPQYLPLPVTLTAPFPTILGGAKQGTALALAGVVTTFSGSSAGFSNRSTSVSPAAKFNRPLAVTSDGLNLYVADYLNNAIRKIEIATGLDITIAGNAFGFAGSADGVGSAASFNLPNGITTDGTSLYVTDSGNFTVRRIDLATRNVTTLAGGVGLAGYVDAPVGTDARFNLLNGITTDGLNLYVTDSSNTIRRVVIPTLANPNASVYTLAGTPGTSGSADGIQGAARFNQPARITTDGLNLYVPDFGNSTIRKIDLATGAVSTIAGKVGPGGAAGSHADSTDGTGLTARFNQPNGITCDGFNLYVTDSYDNAVRKIVLSSSTVYSGPVTTIATIGSGAFDTIIGITTNGTDLFLTDFTADAARHVIRRIQ